MPEHKNQHFVPRCHLKPFSLDGRGLAINAFHLKSRRGIKSAAVKGQCSRSYFYGEDLKLEKILQKIEGRYADVIARLQANALSLSDSDLRTLRDFCVFQMARTEGTVDRASKLRAGLDELIHRGFEEHRHDYMDHGHHASMMTAMGAYLKSMPCVEDLELCILENRTKKDFITSDDPAVLTNRLHIQRLGGRPAGLIASGAQLFLPLTPKYCLVCYDKASYAAEDRRAYLIPLKTESDVRAVNQLQYIHSRDCIYFSNPNDLGRVEEEFRLTEPNRPASWVEFWVGLPTEEKNVFRRAEEHEIASARQRLVMHQHVNVTPSSWIKVLSYRNKVYGLTNGSGVGYIRLGQMARFNGKRHWKEEIRFQPKASLPKSVYVDER